MARSHQGLLDLYDRRAPQVLGLLVHLVGDRAIAEDFLMQVFETVWQRPESFPRASGLTPFTWILALARERALHHGSRKGQIAGSLHQKVGGSPVGTG